MNTPNIASKPLPCTFTRLGLLPHIDGDADIDALLLESQGFVPRMVSLHLTAHPAREHNIEPKALKMGFEEPLLFDKLPRLFLAFSMFAQFCKVENLLVERYPCEHLIEKATKIILMPRGAAPASIFEYLLYLALAILPIDEQNGMHSSIIYENPRGPCGWLGRVCMHYTYR